MSFVCHGTEDEGQKKTEDGDDNRKLGVSHCKIEFNYFLFYCYRIEVIGKSNLVRVWLWEWLSSMLKKSEAYIHAVPRFSAAAAAEHSLESKLPRRKRRGFQNLNT